MVLDEDVSLRIGALGKINFKKGYYLYTGRAKQGLKSRVRRHLRRKKRKRWHIDYLLSRVRITKIFYYHGRLDECIINEEVQKKVKGRAVKNFGSSDCRCGGHLIRVDEEPDL
jgi:sugar fermentation stimulation protein A